VTELNAHDVAAAAGGLRGGLHFRLPGLTHVSISVQALDVLSGSAAAQLIGGLSALGVTTLTIYATQPPPQHYRPYNPSSIYAAALPAPAAPAAPPPGAYPPSSSSDEEDTDFEDRFAGLLAGPLDPLPPRPYHHALHLRLPMLIAAMAGAYNLRLFGMDRIGIVVRRPRLPAVPPPLSCRAAAARAVEKLTH